MAASRAPAARLLALTSSVGATPRAYWGTYAATKAALDNMVLTYGAEIANTSAVRVANRRSRRDPHSDARACVPGRGRRDRQACG